MIRLAVDEDKDQVKKLSLALHKISPYKELPFSDTKFDMWFNLGITNIQKYVVIVAEEQEHLVGVIGGVCTDMPLYDVTITSEMVFYVQPKYRNLEVPIKLLKAYEYWSKEIMKADYCLVGDMPSKDLSKFYEKLNYTPSIMSYMKRNI